MTGAEVFALNVALFGAVLIAGLFLESREKRKALDLRLRDLGLEPSSSLFEVGGRKVVAGWAGVVRGTRVRVGEHGGSKEEHARTILQVEIPGAAKFTLGRRQSNGPCTGDEAFDHLVSVDGDPAAALAVLNAPLRKALCALRLWERNDEGFLVSDGWVQQRRPGPLYDEGLVDWILSTVSFALALKAPDDVAAALARNVEQEPNPSAAPRYLEVLATRFPGNAHALQQLERSLGSNVGFERLVAARHLKTPAAHQSLRALVLDRASDGAARAQALPELLKQGPRFELAPLVAEALGEADPELRLAAIRAAGTLRAPGLLRALEGACRAPSADEAFLLVAMLERFGPAAEDALWLLLTHSTKAVRRKAARALGRVGTLRSVAILHPLARAIFPNGGLTEAAREAIRSIQARVHGGTRGDLRLADSDASEGALAPALEAGALAESP